LQDARVYQVVPYEIKPYQRIRRHVLKNVSQEPTGGRSSEQRPCAGRYRGIGHRAVPDATQSARRRPGRRLRRRIREAFSCGAATATGQGRTLANRLSRRSIRTARTSTNPILDGSAPITEHAIAAMHKKTVDFGANGPYSVFCATHHHRDRSSPRPNPTVQECANVPDPRATDPDPEGRA